MLVIVLNHAILPVIERAEIQVGLTENRQKRIRLGLQQLF